MVCCGKTRLAKQKKWTFPGKATAVTKAIQTQDVYKGATQYKIQASYHVKQEGQGSRRRGRMPSQLQYLEFDQKDLQF